MSASGHTSGYGIWLVPDHGLAEADQIRMYVTSGTTIEELKNELRKKEAKYERKQFWLYNGDKRLEEKASMWSCYITKNDKLKIKFDDKGMLGARRPSLRKSPYSSAVGGSSKVVKKSSGDHAAPNKRKKLSLDETSTRVTPPVPYKKRHHSVNETGKNQLRKPSCLDQNSKEALTKGVGASEKQSHNDETNQQDVQLTIPSIITIIKPPSLNQSWAGLRISTSSLILQAQCPGEDAIRPKTAPTVFNITREISSLQARSSTTDDLVALEAEILCNEKAHQFITSRNTVTSAAGMPAETYDYLKPIVGDIVCAVTDPDRLSSRLLKEGLITSSKHRDIVTTLGLTITNKATQLIDTVRWQMKLSQNPISMLQPFCRAINDDPVLKRFIPILEDKAGVPLARPRTPNKHRITALISMRRCDQCVMSEDDIPIILCKTVTDVAQHWLFLGSVLGISQGELQLIKLTHTKSFLNCYAEVIGTWITTKPSPTWQTFTQHLIQQLDLSDLGLFLREEFCKDCCSFY